MCCAAPRRTKTKKHGPSTKRLLEEGATARIWVSIFPLLKTELSGAVPETAPLGSFLRSFATRQHLGWHLDIIGHHLAVTPEPKVEATPNTSYCMHLISAWTRSTVSSVSLIQREWATSLWSWTLPLHCSWVLFELLVNGQEHSAGHAEYHEKLNVKTLIGQDGPGRANLIKHNNVFKFGSTTFEYYYLRFNQICMCITKENIYISYRFREQSSFIRSRLIILH